MCSRFIPHAVPCVPSFGFCREERWGVLNERQLGNNLCLTSKPLREEEAGDEGQPGRAGLPGTVAGRSSGGDLCARKHWWDSSARLPSPSGSAVDGSFLPPQQNVISALIYLGCCEAPRIAPGRRDRLRGKEPAAQAHGQHWFIDI